jgi:hypothetical protein
VERRVATAPVPGALGILLGKNSGTHFLSAGAVTAEQETGFASLRFAGIGRTIYPGRTVLFKQPGKYSFSSGAFGKLVGIAHALVPEKAHGSPALVPVLAPSSTGLRGHISGNEHPDKNAYKYEKFFQLDYTILTKKNHIL